MEFLQQSLERLFLCAIMLARLRVQGFCIWLRRPRSWSTRLGPSARLAYLGHRLSRKEVCESRGLSGWGLEAGWRFGCLKFVPFSRRQGGQSRPGECLEELVRAPLNSRSGLDSRRVGEERRRRRRRLDVGFLGRFTPSSARLHCLHEFLQVSFSVAMSFLFSRLIQPLWLSL